MHIIIFLVMNIITRNCGLILTADLHYAKNYLFIQSEFVKSPYQAYVGLYNTLVTVLM